MAAWSSAIVTRGPLKCPLDLCNSELTRSGVGATRSGHHLPQFSTWRVAASDPTPLERWGDASHAHGLAAWSVGSKAPPTQPTLMGGARVLSLSIHMVSGPANTRRLRTWDTGIKSGKGELAVTRAPAGGSWRPRSPSLVCQLEGAGEACCDRPCHSRGA